MATRELAPPVEIDKSETRELLSEDCGASNSEAAHERPFELLDEASGGSPFVLHMVGRVAAAELREWIMSSPHTIAIVDVRDADFYGGQITGSQNIPSHRFSESLPNLLSLAETKEKVIFHCSLSQQRGPRASREFEAAIKSLPRRKCEVFILQDGFVGWEKLYGKDPKLTINYDPAHWKYGFQG